MLRLPYRKLGPGAFFLLFLTAFPALAQQPSTGSVKFTNQDCLSCHADGAPIVDQKIFGHSVHGKLNCTDCHRSITDLPHAEKLPKVDCAVCHKKEAVLWQHSGHAQALGNGALKAPSCEFCHGTHGITKATDRQSRLYWANIPAICGQCHFQEYKEYRRGIHGQALASGSRDAPVCTDCHGEHDIAAVKGGASWVSAARIPQTCGQCHSAERINSKYNLASNVLGSYMQSYHGLAMQQGTMTAANCASCHGAHEILPSSDPRSTINPKNLEKTCGRCHPGIGARVASAKIHESFQPGNNPLNDWVSRFYIFFIIFVSGILLLHNVLDFSKKARAHYRNSMGKGAEYMGFNERCQHFILAMTFILLAYTGFSIKFPQTWWSFMFFGHTDWLRWGHRSVAVVFCLLGAYHFTYLFFTPKGRWQLKALSVRKTDFVQFWQSFQYYFGRREDKPRSSGIYSYVQKLEYWALLWGGMVMVLTGALMFNEVWFFSLFPKWLYDVVRTVHLYEAILACVTIVIWHGYFVIFDPEIYPGKGSWLHGRE
ncbi:MAG: cytochrome b/b6 domain-containing protein [Candidatus Omnitrophica bacterium]|nr:cytochrome b/b6 domain-containing protein [Candidatus Omnitrophota bacterium]